MVIDWGAHPCGDEGSVLVRLRFSAYLAPIEHYDDNQVGFRPNQPFLTAVHGDRLSSGPLHSLRFVAAASPARCQCDATTNIVVFYEWEDPRLIDFPEHQPLPDDLWQPEFHVYAEPGGVFLLKMAQSCIGLMYCCVARCGQDFHFLPEQVWPGAECRPWVWRRCGLPQFEGPQQGHSAMDDTEDWCGLQLQTDARHYDVSLRLSHRHHHGYVWKDSCWCH